MSRVLLASCRLPRAGALAGDLRPSGEDWTLALDPWLAGHDAVWIGWPGTAHTAASASGANAGAPSQRPARVPISLSSLQVNRFIRGFVNRQLWPLFHYLPDRPPLDAGGWEAYEEVNALFADAVAREYHPGDRIWVHDFPLLLVPALLRQRLPQAPIGFFLHAPFPSSEVFRTLPWRSRLLRGVLGADVLGFQTFSHLRHFLSAVLHVEGIEVDIDRVRTDGRDVRLGVFPMGIDAGPWAEASEAPAVLAAAAAIRAESGGRTIALGIDRLDDAKGLSRRLDAIERLLGAEPDLRERLRFVQVVVPGGEDSGSHPRLRRDVEERIGRINGAFSTVGSVPIHYVRRRLPPAEVVALYRAADIMMVTPLRDGMSLAAKEFVAARSDGDGVLVLSEFAGAAEELDGAVVINPYDVDGMAAALKRAVTLPAAERRQRMATMRRRVIDCDVHAWVGRFLGALDAASTPGTQPADHASASLMNALTAARAGDIRILLDYDGTLVPFARLPELAAPDQPLIDLLRRLAETEGIRVDLVSGRPREALEHWFGDLPVSLWAEHGFWWRLHRNAPWACGLDLEPAWLDRVRPIIEQFTASTPGSLVEIKTASIAWHYRNAGEEFGARQAHELRLLLAAALSNQPFEVLEGKRVIEIRLRGVSKAVVARSLLAERSTATVVAVGDDHTDEDLFRALPPGSVTIGVGERPTRARFTVRDCLEVRQVLQALTKMARPRPEAAEPQH